MISDEPQLLPPLRRDRASILALALAVACLAGFTLLATLTEAAPTELDRRLLSAMRSHAAPGQLLGPKWIEQVVIGLSAFGGFLTLTIIVMAAFIRLMIKRQRLAALWVLLTSAAGLALEQALKRVVGRPRPDIVPHLERVTELSLPSGHAMMSAVVYLTMALLVCRLVRRRHEKAAVLAAAAAFVLLIGSTRVLLGVHNPSDVLAGWLIGTSWAVSCWLAARGIGTLSSRK